MAEGIVDQFEPVKIQMHQCKNSLTGEKLIHNMVHRATVFKPCQRIGKGLFLRCHSPFLQTRVKFARRAHCNGFGFDQIQHLHCKIGGGKIGTGQRIFPHGCHNRNTKRQV